MINQQFRVAVWAMIAAFGLMVLLALPDPGPVRQRVLAARDRAVGADAPLRFAATGDRTNAAGAPELSLDPGGSSASGAAGPARSADIHALPARSERPVPPPIELGPLVDEADPPQGRSNPAELGPPVPHPSADSNSGPRRPPTAQDPGGAESSTAPRLPALELFAPLPVRPSVRFEPLDEPGPSALPARSPLETRLAGLERQIERLAEQKAGDDVLRRATDLLQQIEQKSQLHDIERKIEQIRSPAASGGSAALAQPPAGLQPPVAAPPDAASSQPPGKAPLLRVAPSRNGDERFSLQITDAEIGQVLEMLGEVAGKNILASPEVQGKVSANLVDVTVDEALAGILRARGFLHEQDERFVYVMTQAEAAARRQAQRKLITKIYRPHYISTNDLQALVIPLLTPEIGKVAVTFPNEAGLPSDGEQSGGDRLSQQDALLVQDYGEVIETVDGVFLEMDIPPPQVVIEAMILSVRLTDQMQFGVNFALLNGSNKQLVVSGNGNALENSSGFPGGGNDSIIPPLGQFVANTAGLKYGFVAGDVTGFLSALENITDTNLIAAPQLRVLNKQRAQLIIGQRLSYTTRTFNNNQTIENVNFLDAGTKLIIRPFIGPDGLIRMEIHPERSSATINPQTNLPDLETTEVTTNVMVRDSTTVVIGGLIEETTVQSYDQIPFLGSLPVAGRLFRNKQERTDRNELIVLITPRIVREEEAAAIGAAAAVENQRRHEFFQNNLSPVNRHNLARMHYERAVLYYDRGELERAANHIEASLRLAKNNQQAHRLRARMQDAQRARWSVWSDGPGAVAPGVPQPQMPQGPQIRMPADDRIHP